MRLKYLSNETVDRLREEVVANIELYRSGSFDSMMSSGEWGVELSLEVDLSPLADLDPDVSSRAEVANSRLVWRALGRLPASLAYEEGIWVRLTHVECLEFSRRRWIKADASDDDAVSAVSKHFFARLLTQRRDDNAVSRLWWNAYIARRLSSDDTLDALPWLLKTADIRSNIVERQRTGSRQKLAAGLVRFMKTHPNATSSEAGFRQFMKSVNKFGGGILFEALSESDVDDFLARSFEKSIA